MYLMTSEFVTVGHPDRTCDQVAAEIINEIYKKDGKAAHAAIEVAMFNKRCLIGGEATTTLTADDIIGIAKHAVAAVGYDKEYRKRFSLEDCYVADDYEYEYVVNRQSPDIAQGVGSDRGWNDQGIYFGYAENTNTTRLGLAHAIAKYLGDELYVEGLKAESIFGIDIKTQVTVRLVDSTTPDAITAITIAAPVLAGTPTEEARAKIKEVAESVLARSQYANLLTPDIKWIINGTGAYTIHGSKGDSSLTGRKIVVNGFGGYAPHGGGSAIKPAHASDRMLPLVGRYIAKAVVDAGLAHRCTVSLATAIGQKELQSLRIDTHGKAPDLEETLVKFFEEKLDFSPAGINALFQTYDKNNFDDVVFSNFMGGDKTTQPWENTAEIAEELTRFSRAAN